MKYYLIKLGMECANFCWFYYSLQIIRFQICNNELKIFILVLQFLAICSVYLLVVCDSWPGETCGDTLSLVTVHSSGGDPGYPDVVVTSVTWRCATSQRSTFQLQPLIWTNSIKLWQISSIFHQPPMLLASSNYIEFLNLLKDWINFSTKNCNEIKDFFLRSKFAILLSQV